MHPFTRLIQPRLRPREGLDTDVVLLGHSMGGILSAEVALLNKHRILGTVNFDTPFLGMHPGVIASGLGSLFTPASESPAPALEGNRVETPLEQDAQNSTSLSHFPRPRLTCQPRILITTRHSPMTSVCHSVQAGPTLCISLISILTV